MMFTNDFGKIVTNDVQKILIGTNDRTIGLEFDHGQ